MKTRFLLLLLLAGILAGCTDYQAEYKKQLQEAFAPVKDKYEFAQNLYKNIGENLNCITTNDLNSLSKEQQAMLSKVTNINDNSEQIYHPEDWIIFHNKAKGGSDIGEYSTYDFFKENTYPSYDHFVNDSTIKKKDNMESALRLFKSQFVDKIKDFKYLIVVTDKILVKPQIFEDGFIKGCILSNVKIYDLNTKQECGSFDVVSENGDIVRGEYTENEFTRQYGVGPGLLMDDFIKDLYDHHKKNIIAEAIKKVHN